MTKLELMKYKEDKHFDDFVWYLSRNLLLKIFRIRWYNDERDEKLLKDIDFILHKTSKVWGLKFPITRLEFGFEEFNIKPFLRVNVDKVYYSEIMKIVEFYKQPENRKNVMNNIDIIFEIKT